MRNRVEIIKEKKKLILKHLEEEEHFHGGYQEWYENLQSFRDLITKRFKNRRLIGLNSVINTSVDSDDDVDYHLLGYLAPMNFKRIGFGGIKRSPSDQIREVARQFEEKGIRFIYLALPCKMAVYPEKIAPKEMIPADGKVIPQWRRMLKECIAEHDVEVLDVYDRLIGEKEVERLYQRGHSISPFGARVISGILSEYLNETIEFESGDVCDNMHFREENIVSESSSFVGKYAENYDIHKGGGRITREKGRVLEPYLGVGVDSEIGIFGNCNLQAFIADGSGIVANTSFNLKYPLTYLGRCLPFSSGAGDTFDSFAPGSLKNIKIAIYVGFPSGSYVRVPHNGLIYRIHPHSIFYSLIKTRRFPKKMTWSTKRLRDEHF